MSLSVDFIATLSLHSDWLRAGRPGGRISSPDRGQDFSALHFVQAGSVARPAFYSIGMEHLFPGLRRPECEDDHLSPPSAEVKNS